MLPACQPARRIRRLIVASCLIAVGLGWSGCSSPTLTVTVPRIEHFTVANSAATPREINRALSRRADAYAATIPGAQTWRGLGLSMEPLIPPDAWITTEPVPYADLQPGQVVLYRARTGRLTAHALYKLTRQGWLAVGVNNDGIIDPTRVTPTNYVGVVTAAFTTTPASPSGL